MGCNRKIWWLLKLGYWSISLFTQTFKAWVIERQTWMWVSTWPVNYHSSCWPRHQKVAVRGWICKVTGNTDCLTTVRTCGCLTLVKTRLYFHLVSVWLYRLEGFGTHVSVPRVNRWFLPCVSPVGFIDCVPYAGFTTRGSSKVSLFGKSMAGAKGKDPRWEHYPSISHFQSHSQIQPWVYCSAAIYVWIWFQTFISHVHSGSQERHSDSEQMTIFIKVDRFPIDSRFNWVIFAIIGSAS